MRRQLLDGFERLKASTRRRLRLLAANVWRLTHVAHTSSQNATRRWGALALWLVVSALLIAALGFASRFEPVVEWLGDKDHLPALQQFLASTGSALIGATAIAFSLILFAMQVNVERVPHGLFRRLSADVPLLASFLCTFTLAVGTAALSLVPAQVGIARSLALTAWGTAIIVLSFVLAYRRAIILISPIEQLKILEQASRRDLNRWGVRARHMEVFLEGTEASPPHRAGEGVALDIRRMTFFRLNPGWTVQADEAIRHAMSMSRTFSERGDHDVAFAALSAVVSINAGYVKAKGATFVAANALFESLPSTDRFINETLESLRQNVQIALSRRDERQLRANFNAFAALSARYLEIPYPGVHSSKTHAQLASGYLARAVQSTVSGDLPDVMMEGIRLMGQVSILFARAGQPIDVATCAKEILIVAAPGLVRPDHIAVASGASEQLANITIALLSGAGGSSRRFAIGDVRTYAFSLATNVVDYMPESVLTRQQSFALAPYFSATASRSLVTMLAEVVNGLGDEDMAKDHEQVGHVIQNLLDWAHDMPNAFKSLLLKVIEKRSSLTIDLIQFSTHVVQVLLAASWVSTCSEHQQRELRAAAKHLLSTFSWIPGDRETTQYVERFSFVDVLFEMAEDAHERESADVAKTAFDLVMNWASKAGRFETGWRTLHQSLVSAVAMCTLGIVTREQLMNSVDAVVTATEGPDIQARFRAAEDLRESADRMPFDEFAVTRVKRAVAQSERALAQRLFNEVANRLVPEMPPADSAEPHESSG